MAETGRVLLAVLDGWGYSPVYEGNAIANASTPTMDRLWQDYPHTLLQASGEAVGLPWGEMGNSEVGHLNIGAGRVVPQDLPRIAASIADGSFFENEAFLAAFDHVKQTGGALHLIGLVSSGGVHSHLRHLLALLQLAKQRAVSEVFVHLFTDGRDAPPHAAEGQIRKLEGEMAELGLGEIASVSGRYFAMDRDRHWDRVKPVFEAIACGKGRHATSAEASLQKTYADGLTDEFVEPTVIVRDGQPVAKWTEQDAAIFFNFRPDRMRQLTEALVRSDFDAFDRGSIPTGLHFVTMTRYEAALPVHVAFQPQNVVDPLAKVLADAGIRQFHIAETEKYPHATFFFNGGFEEPNPLEERLLIPSPKVATYDEAPEMSSAAIGQELVKRMEQGDYGFIMANFANADMVGHTGNFAATVKACEAIDSALGQVVEAAAAHGFYLLVTADHGNAEQMQIAASGEIDPEHTTNPVPFIVVPPNDTVDLAYDETRLTRGSVKSPTGLLGDVAPTALKLIGLPVPDGMEGYGLL